MATCNMMRDPVFQILSFASPKVVTPLNVSWKVPQHDYVFGIFVMKLLIQFLYCWRIFSNETVRVEEKLPSLLFLWRWIVLYKHKPNKLSSRSRPSTYCNKCCPHSLMGTSPRSMSYISPTPPGNNHGYELSKICFVWLYSLSNWIRCCKSIS